MVRTAARTDWDTIEEWNDTYVVRTFSSQDEYQWIPIESTEGDYPTWIVLGKCLEKGVLLGGFVPNTLRIGASLTVSRDDMDTTIDALDSALDHLDSRVRG